MSPEPSQEAVEIKQRRKALKLSQKDLASMSGIHWVTISRIERGETAGSGIQTIKAIIEALDAVEAKNKLVTDTKPPAWAERKSEHKGRRVRLIGKIPAGDPRVVDLGDGGSIDLPESMLPDDDVCALIVNGKSMCPTFIIGDVVILRCVSGWGEVEKNQICAVADETGDATLKKVEFRPSEDGKMCVWLVPENQELGYNGEPMFKETKIDPTKWTVLGVVCGLFRKF